MAQYNLLIYLVACALHNAVPEEEYLEGQDLSTLYRFAQDQSLTAAACMALEKTDAYAKADSSVQKQWKEAKEKSIRKNILLDVERNQIFSSLDAEKIWYMPLKGSVLKAYYPREGMREMSDNDILYDPGRMKDVQKIFEKRGYTTASLGRRVHDEFEKPPIYFYEMHRALFSEYDTPKLAEYYKGVKEKLLRDSDSSYAFHFSDNDFYVHITAHAGKHNMLSGAGFRMLVDSYILLKKYENLLDWSYINEQLRQMELTEFEATIRNLGQKLFSAPIYPSRLSLSSEERELLEFCSSSGTYGTKETNVKRKYQKGLNGKTNARISKLRYCISRIFPGRKWCKDPYPFFYKHPLLLPFLWIFRIVNGLLRKRMIILNEVRIIRSIKEDDIK